jgi:hypothetical protein
MPKIDMFQCDNRHCPDASETRGDPLESDWLVLQGEGGPRFSASCRVSRRGWSSTWTVSMDEETWIKCEGCDCEVLVGSSHLPAPES